MGNIKNILIYAIPIIIAFAIGMIITFTYENKVHSQLYENVTIEKQCNCTNNVSELTMGVYYNPLRHIYWYDTFNDGLAGWDVYRESKARVYSGYLPNERDQTLTRGGLSGEKVMIIEGGTAIKRTSWLWKNKIRLETWYIFKNFNNTISQDNLTGSVTFKYDTQIGVSPGNYFRSHFAMKFRNLNNNKKILQQWNYLSNEYMKYNSSTKKDEYIEEYVPLPGNPIQELTYNEKYKYDWNYLRLDIDLDKHEYVEFQSNDRIWDLRGIKKVNCVKCGEENVLNNLLNFAFSISSVDSKKPSTLAIDSVIMSADD